MNVILRNSTRRMIDQSRASIEAEALSRGCYLRFMPAVVALASDRFAHACGDLIDGGAV